MAADLTKERPLAGVVLCCTSISPDARQALAVSAMEMGAEHKFDLTSDVTHLIVGSTDTQKYKYVARERADVKIVLPGFIEAVREEWMQGGETDVAGLERTYRVKTLWELQICLTGFDDVNQRDHIKSLVEEYGARYHGDLTKAVTHLIAAAPTGKKYEHACRWGIKVVSLEWLDESIERGMVLDEMLYNPRMNPAARGRGAWNRQTVHSITQGKRQRESEKPTEPVKTNKRKIRRTMSAKLGSQQGNMWAEIASAGSATAKQEEGSPAEFDSVLTVIPAQIASGEVTPDPTIETSKTKISMREPTDSTQTQGVFRNNLVYVHGFPGNKSEILRTHLESHGARICTSPADLLEEEDLENGYLIIPHDVPEDSLPPVPAMAKRLQQVTEWWVESCLAKKTLINPVEYPLCRPFKKLAVEGFEDMTICVSGFLGVDLLHVTKVIKLMGASYEEYLVAGRNLLLCKAIAPNKEKLEFAIDNGVPVVTEQWLWASLEEGVKQDFKEFELGRETPTIPVEYQPQKSRSKSLGKAKLPLKSERSQQLRFQKPALDRRNPLQVAPTKAPSNPKRTGPFTEEDLDDNQGLGMMPQLVEDDIPLIPSQPLRQLSQGEVNSKSPKRSSQLSYAEPNASASPKKEIPHPASAHPTDLDKVPGHGSANFDNSRMNDVIMNLLAQKKHASRPNSVAPGEEVDPVSKRRRGKLGRAISGSLGSNPSGALSRNNSVSGAVPILAPSQQQRLNQEEEREKGDQAPPIPSQKIIYEDEKAREERAKLIARLGGQVINDADEGRVVRSIGVVKDAVVGDGGGLRRRHRAR